MQQYYDIYEEAHRPKQIGHVSVLSAIMLKSHNVSSSGFDRMQKLRKALESLDSGGWKRSYHQRLFHEKFLCACSRVFWKTEKPGQFAKDHLQILQRNGWENLAQEILISTPRR